MPSLIDVWNALKREADQDDAEVLDRLVEAYSLGYENITPEIEALTEYLESIEYDKTKVKNSAAYKNLIKAATRQLDAFEGYLETEVNKTVKDNAVAGIRGGDILLLSAIALALNVEVKDLPKDAIQSVDAGSLKYLAEYLKPDGALMDRINGLSNYHGEQIAEGILERVGLGQNPKTIADWISSAYSMGLTDSMRICRTAQLYSYRNASAETQKANSELLQGGVWCAELDDRCCESCIALHGTVFPVGEIAADHHGGRCTILPWLKGEPNPIDKSGEDWFKEQPEQTQKDILGDAKWQALQDGKFEFSQLSTVYNDDVYGEMRRAATLKELTEE